MTKHHLAPWLVRILEADLKTVGHPNDYRVLLALGIIEPAI